MYELKKTFNIIRALAIAGLVLGFIIGLSFEGVEGIGGAVLFALLGGLIGVGLQAVPSTFKWVWKYAKPVLYFFFPFNNDSGSTFVQIRFLLGLAFFPFILSILFAPLFATPFIGIYRAVSIIRQLRYISNNTDVISSEIDMVNSSTEEAEDFGSVLIKCLCGNYEIREQNDFVGCSECGGSTLNAVCAGCGESIHNQDVKNCQGMVVHANERCWSNCWDRISLYNARKANK